MKTLSCTALAVTAALLMLMTPAIAKNKPNPRANALCAFGPGSSSSRWPIKGSVPNGALLTQAKTVKILDLIVAPNLASGTTVPSAYRISGTVHIGSASYAEGTINEEVLAILGAVGSTNIPPGEGAGCAEKTGCNIGQFGNKCFYLCHTTHW